MAVLFDWNLSRCPCLLCKGLGLEYAALFLALFLLWDQWTIERLSKANWVLLWSVTSFCEIHRSSIFTVVTDQNLHNTFLTVELCLHHRAFRGIRVDIVYLLASISASSTNLKRIQTSHNLFSDFGAEKTFVGQAAEFKFESKLDPLQASGNHSWSLFQKTIEGFESFIFWEVLNAKSMAEFNFESNLEPLQASGNHSRSLLQKTIEGFESFILTAK